MRHLPALAVLLAAPAAWAQAQPDGLAEDLKAPGALQVGAPANDDGRHIALSWKPGGTTIDGQVVYLVFRAPAPSPGRPPVPPADVRPGWHRDGWMLIAIADDTRFTDEIDHPPGEMASAPPTVWRLDGTAAPPPAPTEPGAATEAVPPSAEPPLVYAVRAAVRTDAGLTRVSPPALAGPVEPKTSWFNDDRWFFGALVLLMAGGLVYYTRMIRRSPEKIYIRRIAGIDAIEDAVGRSTEMGRPVLYVTGTDDIQNIMTIASLLVLGRVAEMTAEYDSEIKVANYYPLTMVVAEEVVKQGYANAGRIDAHRPENVMFISAEQFAYAAGINGIMMRERPATNIMLGRFFAESLILAETGYVTGAVQVAGTAEIPQLPFFVAACDYTLIGEELYAASAYMSREPALLAMLKSTDLGKALIVVLILVGVFLSATHIYDGLGALLIP